MKVKHGVQGTNFSWVLIPQSLKNKLMDKKSSLIRNVEVYWKHLKLSLGGGGRGEEVFPKWENPALFLSLIGKKKNLKT